jgi:ribosomal protein L32
MSRTSDRTCGCGGEYRLRNRRTSDEGPKHQVPVCDECGHVDT